MEKRNSAAGERPYVSPPIKQKEPLMTYEVSVPGGASIAVKNVAMLDVTDAGAVVFYDANDQVIRGWGAGYWQWFMRVE